MNQAPSPAERWHQHARRTVRRVDFAWWLQYFAPAAAGLGLLSLLVVLVLRMNGVNLPHGPVAGSLAAIYLVTGLLCWLLARKKFPAAEQGMVLLESRLRLHNSLTAATKGVTTWPEPPGAVDDGIRFRAPWLIAPAMLTVICLLLAFLLPVSQAEAPPAVPPPLALNRAEAIIDALAKEEVADPAALEKAREQLEALLNQSPEQFYTHHSLEAADTLETSLQKAAAGMGEHLQTAAQSAETLEKFDSSLSPSAKQQLESDLNAALEGLRNSSLGLNEALQKQLSQLDPSKLKELDPAQLQKMLQNLKEKAAACKACQEGNCDSGSEAEQALMALLNGELGEGSGPGEGGIGRGPGTAPLTTGPPTPEMDGGKMEQLESADLTRSLPGDHLGTRDMEHRLDRSSSVQTDGGASTEAGGGDSVLRHQLMPSEQKVLQRYFQ